MEEVLAKIQTILSRGESIQLVTLPGMGSSRLLAKLSGFTIHPHALPTLNSENLIAVLNSITDPKLIIIDHFHELLKLEISPFFTHLKILRDQHKYQLSYIFINQTGKPIPPSATTYVHDLYPVMSENLIYLPAISKASFGQKIKSEFHQTVHFNPNSNQLEKIYSLSGGIPYLVKIIMQNYRDKKPENFLDHPAVSALFEQYLDILGNPPNQEILKNLNIQSQLLKDFYQKRSQNQLSASETRLLNLLLIHQGEIVSKDQICEAVYPETKSKEGISDASIDQLIYRLRSKISDKYTLTTHRGFGYKLNNI